ncbi:phage major capsid protein [Oryzibacter oryziterrae]|uniref:phage major capsid protein n=1 Tax=Oryzibacter oryziterrae TaxID=2766474 RepID=UPI001F0287B2|nr:phage major capsid protein [Oryzibacter oryziterrae]
MKLHELRETRAGKVAELSALAAKDLAGNAGEQEVARFNTLDDEIRALDRSIARVERADELARMDRAEPVGGREMTRELRNYSVSRAVRGQLDGRLDGLEGEVHTELSRGREVRGVMVPTDILLGETRALTTTTPAGGPGSNLVATQLSGDLIDRFRPKLAVQAMGAKVLSGLVGNLDIPRQKGSGSAGWVAEHGAATRSDVTFDKVGLTPKTVAAEYELSRRMLLNATAIEDILKADLGWLIAQAIDSAAIAGAAAPSPVGLFNIAGVQTYAMGTNGAALTYTSFPDIIGLIDAADDSDGARGFLTNTKVKKAGLKILDGMSRPLGWDVLTGGERIVFSNQMPSNLTKGTGTNLSSMIYGTWSDLIIAYWSGVDIVANPYHSDVASKGGVLLHAFLDADVQCRHPESFVVVKDIIA